MSRSTTCMATGCETRPAHGAFFCTLHWSKLPGRLRSRLAQQRIFSRLTGNRDLDRAVQLLEVAR